MPKLERAGEADNRGATDFIESLDRGLRVLELFGGGQQPMTLSDLARARCRQKRESSSTPPPLRSSDRTPRKICVRAMNVVRHALHQVEASAAGAIA